MEKHVTDQINEVLDEYNNGKLSTAEMSLRCFAILVKNGVISKEIAVKKINDLMSSWTLKQKKNKKSFPKNH